MITDKDRAAVQIHMLYTPEKREGFTTVDAHYAGAGWVAGPGIAAPGTKVKGQGLTYSRCLEAVLREAAVALGKDPAEHFMIRWCWGGGYEPTGRSDFPADVEAGIVRDERERQEEVARKDAQYAEVEKAVAEIMGTALPGGWRWIPAGKDAPFRDPEGLRYADGGWVGVARDGQADREFVIDVDYRQARTSYGAYGRARKPGELWVTGPYIAASGRAKRCKVGAKGWAQKVAEIARDHIESLGLADAREKAHAERWAHKQEVIKNVLDQVRGSRPRYDDRIRFAECAGPEVKIVGGPDLGGAVRVEISATLSPGELVTLVAALRDTVDGADAVRRQQEADEREAAGTAAQAQG